jgi:hypothetical protein
MRLETYSVFAEENLMTIDFFSEGSKGIIKKRIEFQKTKNERIFNLAFGDVDSITNDFDDSTISNNNDTTKVLATVALSVYLFLMKYPNTFVIAEGNTASRTRLYRMGISKYFEEFSENFNIFGFNENGKWVEFKKNEQYSAFYIIRK